MLRFSIFKDVNSRIIGLWQSLTLEADYLDDICIDLTKQTDKKKLSERLRNPYRLTIAHESTFEERFTTRLTPWKVIFFFVSVFIISGIIVYAVVALSPLKEHLVPEFADFEYREDARESRLMVDSLSQLNAQKDAYIYRIRAVLNGEVVEEQLPDTLGLSDVELPSEYIVSAEDSALRAQMARDNSYSLQFNEEQEASLKRQLLFKPLNGSLSSDFDPSIGHYGIDIIAPRDGVVKAVQDGTVTFASYTSDGGHVIQIQHSNGLLSVYKHNSTLFKTPGEPVIAGESIAVVGNTGEETDGPHLHLELWLDGVPIDPREFFVFEEN